MDTDVPEVWLTREQVAQRFQIPVKTVAEWGRAGYGPPYALIGRHCRYPLDRLIEWEQALLNHQSHGIATEPGPYLRIAETTVISHDD